MGRVTQAGKAERLNLARSLLQDSPDLPHAVKRLSAQLGLSVRLPRGLIRRLRERSAATGTAVSEVVARALRAWLASREPHG